MNNANHKGSKDVYIFVVYARVQPITYLLKLLPLNTVIYWSANIAPNKPYIIPNKGVVCLIEYMPRKCTATLFNRVCLGSVKPLCFIRVCKTRTV